MPKRLELLKELLPNARDVFARSSGCTNAYKLLEEAAPRRGVHMQVAQVEAAEDLLAELTIVAKEP